jgi:hypothetical protein
MSHRQAKQYFQKIDARGTYAVIHACGVDDSYHHHAFCLFAGEYGGT